VFVDGVIQIKKPSNRPMRIDQYLFCAHIYIYIYIYYLFMCLTKRKYHDQCVYCIYFLFIYIYIYIYLYITHGAHDVPIVGPDGPRWALQHAAATCAAACGLSRRPGPPCGGPEQGDAGLSQSNHWARIWLGNRQHLAPTAWHAVCTAVPQHNSRHAETHPPAVWF